MFYSIWTGSSQVFLNTFYVEFLDRAENDPNLFFPEQPWLCMDITIVCNVCENYFMFFLNINVIVFPYMFLGSVVEKVLSVWGGYGIL